MKRFLLITALFALYRYHTIAQTTVPVNISLNESWQFTRDDFHPGDADSNKNSVWQTVHLPHTWNASDVMDDEPGYYRGIGWYKKQWQPNKSWQSKEIFLHFEGVNQEAEVYINGRLAGRHTGGYTEFIIPVQQFLRFDAVNELVVKADNSFNKNIPPLSADFTFYGGIYRDVWVEVRDKIHFTRNEFGANDVYITTPVVTQASATVEIKGMVSCKTTEAGKVKIETILYDKSGKRVAANITGMSLKPGENKSFIQQLPAVMKPNLWEPGSPYLYRAVTRVTSQAGNLLDEVVNAVGFRWYSFDADKGFFLNGKSLKLIGASRHQDFEAKGNALTDGYARRDVQLIKEMGGNFLRVAHYPQDPAVLQACDELGILASVEIPVVNEITETDSFYNNCLRMQQEMIKQHYNHPSVIMWCYMNEVLLRPHYTGDKEQQQRYFSNIAMLAKRLDSLTRKEDPARFTMIACHGDFEKYRSTGITAIPMLLGWNLYSGWYGGNLPDFAGFLDKHHRELPGIPLLVTEYGADADPRIRSFKPVRFDKSVEYATKFHQYYLKAIQQRAFVAGAFIWNLADFNSETRIETMPHINNKGLLMWNRTAKDVYLWHKAMLTAQPLVSVAAPYWKNRTGMADSNTSVCYQPFQAVSNLDSLWLSINQTVLPAQKVIDGLCEWQVPFQNGLNRIEVWGTRNGQKYTDVANIDFQLIPYTFNSAIPFTSLNILLGANRYFLDDEQQVWIPDQAYRAGSWGHKGGQAYYIPGNNRLPYGTDKDIAGTGNDPVYQTQQVGIREYKLDVPDGVYELTLHFAELQGGIVKGLTYNLSAAGRKETPAVRVFDVMINDRLVLEKFNIAEQYGVSRAIAKKVTVHASGQKGISILFNPIEGEPVLNALQVTKLY